METIFDEGRCSYVDSATGTDPENMLQTAISTLTQLRVSFKAGPYSSDELFMAREIAIFRRCRQDPYPYGPFIMHNITHS